MSNESMSASNRDGGVCDMYRGGKGVYEKEDCGVLGYGRVQ